MLQASSLKPQARIAQRLIAVGLACFIAGAAVPHAARALAGSPSPKPQAASPVAGALSSGVILIAVPDGTSPAYVYTERAGLACESGRDVWSVPIGSILMPCEIGPE